MGNVPSLDTIGRIYRDTEVIPVMLRSWDLFMIFQASTMTLTHPNLPDDSKAYFTELAKQLEARLAEDYPELQPLMKMCWNRQLTLTDDPDKIAARERWIAQMTARERRKTGRK